MSFVVFFLFLSVQLNDSLPWKGTIVFGPKVRVDDADSVIKGHPAQHPHTILDEKTLTLYTVWEDDRHNTGAYEIFFARSTDTAKTWSRPNINLSNSPRINDQYPWLAVDSANIYVVWQSWRNNRWKVYFTKSTDGGKIWTTPDTIPGILIDNDQNSGINFGPQPKIVVDNRSNPDTTFIYLIWADGAGNNPTRIKLARSIDNGNSFVDLGIIDKNPGMVNRHPHIAVDDSGWIHCVWDRGTGGNNQDPHPWIGYNRSTNRGISFRTNDILVNDDFSEVYRGNPSVTYNPNNGNILVCWEDSRRAGGNANPDIWFSRMHRTDSLFAQNQRVNWWAPDTTVRYDNFRPVIRMDPMGVMVAAWHDDPEKDGSYGIHMAAYLDTIGRFSYSQALLNTYTGTTGANFGNAFYPPGLFVTMIDSITNFFLVWQDFFEDSTGGNIYSIRGWVVELLADIDVDNDSLDVKNDTINLYTQPAGPAYSPYAKGRFILANTSQFYNPDTIDGPSISRVDSLCFFSTWDTTFILGLPFALGVGQIAICTLAIVIPEGIAPGIHTGSVTIMGVDSLGGPTSEIFYFKLRGPEPRKSLDSLRVVPIPFKPHRNPDHDAIHFQGLPAGARVKIYDLAGALVFSATEDGDGHIKWAARVASGIYIYVVTAPDGDVKKGKLSVIR
ncbi:MAG: T9SS type A sorting domain-containing protein [candidate division WOR-3 bacterium]|nr:T9SS type A sorting domain-containing protein [candidate division WOR-3 bacterium]